MPQAHIWIEGQPTEADVAKLREMYQDEEVCWKQKPRYDGVWVVSRHDIWQSDSPITCDVLEEGEVRLDEPESGAAWAILREVEGEWPTPETVPEHNREEGFTVCKNVDEMYEQWRKKGMMRDE